VVVIRAAATATRAPADTAAAAWHAARSTAAARLRCRDAPPLILLLLLLDALPAALQPPALLSLRAAPADQEADQRQRHAALADLPRSRQRAVI
jgi:hypothetical protein